MITRFILVCLLSAGTLASTPVIHPVAVINDHIAPVAQNNAPQTPRGRNFISVEGATLAARREAAIRQGRALSPAARFWTAHGFDVRPGVAVDLEFKGESPVNFSSDGVGVSFNGKYETRNLGVFLLHETDGAVQRVEIYNLDRAREYSGYPVYWL
ncbi:MAG: hypothetical protein ACKV2V_06980, partial [Blastocatellia bacterium]